MVQSDFSAIPQTSDINIIHLLLAEVEKNDRSPSSPSNIRPPKVKITELNVTEFPPGGMFDYEIHFEIQNFENYNVTVQMEHTLILPNGRTHKWSEKQLIPGNMSLGAFILYKYNTNLYGKYTYVLTVKDTFGVMLDQKSISWIREPSRTTISFPPFFII